MKIQKYRALSTDHMYRAVGSYFQMPERNVYPLYTSEPDRARIRHYIVQKSFVDWGMKNSEELIEIDPYTLEEADEYWDTDAKEV